MEHTAEEVRKSANWLYQWERDWLYQWERKAGVRNARAMLTAYAERIEADEGAVAVACIPFGHGNVVVTTGKHGGAPCVYLAPASMPGVVGESAARENLPRNKRVPGESILTFPTAKQAAIVAFALCGKYSNPPAPVEPTEAVISKAVEVFLNAAPEWNDYLVKDGMRAALLAVWPNPPAQAAQGEASLGRCKACGRATRAVCDGLDGNGLGCTNVPPIDLAAVRKVIAEIRRCAGNNNAKFHLTWADKLEAALAAQESNHGSI